MLFKAGSKEKQHIVSVKPNGTGCMFQLFTLRRGRRQDSSLTLGTRC